MEENDGAWLSIGEVTAHTLEVEAASLRVVIGVVTDFEAGSLEDLVVVSPSWLRHVDGCLAELGKEVS